MKTFAKAVAVVLVIPLLLFVLLILIPVLVVLMVLFGVFAGRRWSGGYTNWHSTCSHPRKKQYQEHPDGDICDVECTVLNSTPIEGSRNGTDTTAGNNKKRLDQ